MKNYKQILEAINRGIQFALDDFDPDDIQLSKPKQETITKEDSLWQNLELQEHVVDLGLPSGTLWCKYNLNVDSNQLFKAEDWYGGYYAWGKLEPNKSEFSWSTYKHAEHYTDLSEKDCLTKYCNNPQKGYNQIRKTWGFTDNLTKLLSEDDAAYQNKKLYNFKFHIPTKEQCEELIKYTNNYWVNNYDPNKAIHNLKDDSGIKGLNGRIFEGKNGNQLFIPAAGYRDGFDNIYNVNSCYLLSSSLDLDNSDSAYYLGFSSDNIYMYSGNRYLGFTIRPVINL